MLDRRRGAGHQVGRALGFREGDHLADIRLLREQRHGAVDAGRHAAVRRRTQLERVEHVPELGALLLLADAEHPEDALLQLALMDADAAAADLPAVAGKVVLIAANHARIALEQTEIGGERRREQVMERVPALVVLIPLDERRIDDKREQQRIRIGEL